MTLFKLNFGLKLEKLHYSHTDKLLETLQSEKMTVVSTKRFVMLALKSSVAWEMKKILTQSTIYV